MRIAKVYIKNFRGYGENNTTDGMYLFDHLDDAEVVIFSGYNGFGKTGFFEAIEWCMTGKIKGLQETDIYGKYTMKNSSYLKFQSTKDKRERNVVVRIIFDNGWGITRETTCIALEENGYIDTVIDLHGNIIEQQYLNDRIKQWTGQSPEQVLKLSFNGQNRNTDFVKSTKAKERTSALLEFMGLKLLDDIVTESDSKKRKKLKSKYDQADREYKNVVEEVKRIDRIFEENKWGSIKEYSKEIEVLLEEINTYREEMMQAGIRQNISLSYANLNELLNSLDIIRILKEVLEKQAATDERQISEITKRRLRNEWYQLQQFLNSAHLVKKSSLKDLEKDKERFNSLQNTYLDTIDKLRKIKEKIQLDLAIKVPVVINTAIGIAEEEKVQYVTHLKNYKEMKEIGNNFSVHGNYNYNEFDIEREFRRSEKYSKCLKDYESIITLQKRHLKEMEGMYSEQNEFLIHVQGFVNEQDEIKKCPVCDGTDFIKEEHNGKVKLLELISTRIANGNHELKKKNDNIVKMEERLRKFREKVYKNIRIKYQTNLNSLISEINRLKECIYNECELRISCNEESFNKFGTRLSMVLSQINQIHEFTKNFPSVDFGIEEIIQKKEKQKSKLEETLRVRFQEYDVANFNNLRGKDENNLIIPLFRRRNLIEKVLKYMEKTIHYDIGEENRNILRLYEEKCKRRTILEKQVSLLNDAIKFRSIINENSKILETDLLKTLIENNKLINWIYSKINPHPYFREVSLKIMKEETGILSAEDNNVYLDHIFSEAQMNVLSLSIFLGLILSVNNYDFKQIFLDDPVQSLDDINVVSFIDLLRALIRSEHVDKNYIISTHDHNFSKLLKIKLRNYNFVEYRFISYGEEGPRINMVRSNV